MTPVAPGMSDAVAALTTMGIAPVIVLAATIFVAVLLFKRFRR